MAVSADFVAHVMDLFAGSGPLRAKRMFGGVGLYAGDAFFALIDDDTLYLKTDEATRGRFEDAGARPFTFDKAGESVVTSYWSLPDEAWDDAELALDWARLALEAVMRKPVRGAKRR